MTHSVMEHDAMPPMSTPPTLDRNMSNTRTIGSAVRDGLTSITTKQQQNQVAASEAEKPTAPKPPSCVQQKPVTLPIEADNAGKKALSIELFERFQSAKTYGKDPDSLETTVTVFIRDLAQYPIERIKKAFSTHARRSPEFPTVYDIDGLIKRNGRPPLSEAMYISLSRKDYHARTSQEHQYIKDYEAMQLECWDDEPLWDMNKTRAMQEDNADLRTKLREARREIVRLGDLVNQLKRERPAPEKSKLTEAQRIQNTLDHMQASGASEQEIEAFKASCTPPMEGAYI